MPSKKSTEEQVGNGENQANIPESCSWRLRSHPASRRFRSSAQLESSVMGWMAANGSLKKTLNEVPPYLPQSIQSTCK